MSLTTLRPEFSPLPSNLLSKTQRRSFTPTNLISPHPSIHSPIPKSQKRPPPRLILRPDSQASSLSAGQKRERRFGNVRSKEIPLSVPNQMGGYGSIGQLRMITKDVKKDTVKRGQKKVIADNELHNMRYKMSSSRYPDFVRYDITAWRKFNGVPREATKRRFSTVASKEAWENELKDVEDKTDGLFWAPSWWFRAY